MLKDQNYLLRDFRCEVHGSVQIIPRDVLAKNTSKEKLLDSVNLELI